MEIVSINCDYAQLRTEVLPVLRGKVFHVTSGAGFDGIQQSGDVASNIDGRFEFTFSQSKISFGRKRGYVCLFNLREKSGCIIDRTLECLYFLNPKEWDVVVFLIIDPIAYAVLIPNSKAKEKTDSSKEMWVPDVEVWHPGKLSLSKISRVLKVNVLNIPNGHADMLKTIARY